MRPALIITLVLSLAAASTALAAGALVVDAGHGGYDNGFAQTALKEKDAVLLVARKVEALAKAAHSVTLTRTTDAYTALDARISIARKTASPKTFLSLHMTEGAAFVIYTAAYPAGFDNAPVVAKFSVHARQFEYLADSKRLAEAMAAKFKKTGLRQMELPGTVLGDIDAPAIIIEMPGRLLKDESKLDGLARDIVAALDAFEAAR